MLTLLSGRRHRLYTGLCVVAPNSKPRFRLVQTHVTFKRLSLEELNWYLDSSEWQGVCGAYKIQGKASFFMTSIQGTPSNIIGLPLADLYALLVGTGYPLFKV
jgi:septum formation protein